jgi:hypothetical protein
MALEAGYAFHEMTQERKPGGTLCLEQDMRITSSMV